MKNERFICYGTTANFESDYQAGTYAAPYMAYTYDDEQLHYIDEDYGGPLKITNNTTTAGTITMTVNKPASDVTVQYSQDKGSTWTSLTQTSSATSVSIPLAASGET